MQARVSLRNPDCRSERCTQVQVLIRYSVVAMVRLPTSPGMPAAPHRLPGSRQAKILV